jgi:hypothetical protein
MMVDIALSELRGENAVSRMNISVARSRVPKQKRENGGGKSLNDIGGKY